MTFLQDCANATPGGATAIPFPALTAANFGDLLRLKNGTVPNVRRLFRRQAGLLAVDDENQDVGFLAHIAVLGHDPGFLASVGLDIRSSHSGAPIDPLLPQGPYTTVAPPAAALVGLRGRANFTWLRDSVTDHTSNPAPATGLDADPNRVPSYFEVHIPVIRGDFNIVKLDGGRLCYDPFNHRMYVSQHYTVQYEITSLPALTTIPDYAALRAEIQAHALALAGGGGLPWTALYNELIRRMGVNQL